MDPKERKSWRETERNVEEEERNMKTKNNKEEKKEGEKKKGKDEICYLMDCGMVTDEESFMVPWNRSLK